VAHSIVPRIRNVLGFAAYVPDADIASALVVDIVSVPQPSA